MFSSNILNTSWISCISVARIISPPGLVAAPRSPVPGHGTVPRGPKASGTPPEALPVVLQGWLQHRPSPAAALLAWSSQGWPSVGRRPGNFQCFAADIFLEGFDPSFLIIYHRIIEYIKITIILCNNVFLAALKSGFQVLLCYHSAIHDILKAKRVGKSARTGLRRSTHLSIRLWRRTQAHEKHK